MGKHPAWPVQDTTTAMGSVFVLVSAALYGASPILVKVAYAHGASPLTVLALRYATALVLLWSGVVLFRVSLKLPRSAILPVAVLGATLVPLQAFTFFFALARLPASTVSVLGYVYPLHAAWMGWLFLREPMHRNEVIILVGVVLGAVLVAGQTPRMGDMVGLAALTVATLAHAVYYVVARRILRYVRPIPALALALVATAIVFASASFLSGDFTYPLAMPALVAILGNGILASLSASLLLLAGLRVLPVARVAMLGSLEPVITVGLSVLFLGDRVTIPQYLGMAAVIVGIRLIQIRHGSMAPVVRVEGAGDAMAGDSVSVETHAKTGTD